MKENGLGRVACGTDEPYLGLISILSISVCPRQNYGYRKIRAVFQQKTVQQQVCYIVALILQTTYLNILNIILIKMQIVYKKNAQVSCCL